MAARKDADRHPFSSLVPHFSTLIPLISHPSPLIPHPSPLTPISTEKPRQKIFVKNLKGDITEAKLMISHHKTSSFYT